MYISYNTSADQRHDVNYEKHMALLCASNITYNILKNKWKMNVHWFYFI